MRLRGDGLSGTCRPVRGDVDERRDPLAHARTFVGGLDGRLHFVTHSMGGLVARSFINRHRPDNLGRVVALAPPNGGSEVADFLSRNLLYQRYFGPAGAQLTTTRDDDLDSTSSPAPAVVGAVLAEGCRA